MLKSLAPLFLFIYYTYKPLIMPEDYPNGHEAPRGLMGVIIGWLNREIHIYFVSSLFLVIWIYLVIKAYSQYKNKEIEINKDDSY